MSCPATVKSTGRPCSARRGHPTFGGYCGRHRHVAIARVPAVVATYRPFVEARDRLRAAISLNSLSDTPATRRSCDEATDAVRTAAEAYDGACRLAWSAAAATATAAAAAAAAPVANVVHTVPATVSPTAATVSPTAVPVPDTAEAAAQRRAARAALNADRLDRCPNLSHSETANLLTRLGLLWANTPLPGNAVLVAYGVLRHTPAMDPRLPPILRAVLHLMYLTKWYHPDRTEFVDVPERERRDALHRLTMLVVPLFPERMTASFLPPTDPMRPRLEERLREEALRAERLRVEDQVRRRAEERRVAEADAFEAQMRDDAVVFTRDPEGSIDLRAFATDVESVHRSSVQSATEHSIGLLLDRDVPLGQDTLAEIGVQFRYTIPWRNDRELDRALHEIATDFLDTIAFSVRYGDVLDRVWAFIAAHAERNELVVRLGQEVVDGYGTCANGKMARLVNVLRGYDETLILNPPKEAFQEKMARLRVRPVEERGLAAAALFEEYGIAEEERGAWLEALAE